jgi:ferrous iron transport protein B
LFNVITGSYAYVGNWAGVTVEKKVGLLKNKQAHVIDLPGVYSVNPLSADETVVTRFLLNEPFAAILNIVDASQLERNLYLTVQLLEFGKPLIVALNMIDVARGRGVEVDPGALARGLGVRVLPIVARTGKGCDAVARELSEGRLPESAPLRLDYGPELEAAAEEIAGRAGSVDGLPARWLALQYMEGNAMVEKLLERRIEPDWLKARREAAAARIAQASGAKSLQQYIRQVRGEWIARLAAEATRRTGADHSLLTDRIDAVVTNKYLGMPIFLLTMFLMFKLTFDWVGTPLSDALDGFINGTLAGWIGSLLDLLKVSPFIRDLILQGIIGGVGGVLAFVPQIFMLFLLISFIEDSGYMARVAMVMDRIMESIGLNGKAFIPMIIGFGCNVPGIMAARTVEQPKERLLTILLTPLMSCSARLSVYSLFAGTFFRGSQSVVVFSLYVLGIAVALLMAKVFSGTLFRNERSLFFVELPPYRVPQWRTLALSTWEKGKGFIRKAGTFIFGGSVVIWLLGYAGPKGLNVPMDESFLAMIGGLLAPLLQPLGFGSWQAGAALITGFLAKEVVVSTMNIIYAAPDLQTLHIALGQQFDALQAYAFMAFILLYVPCLATVAVISKETGSKKWTWFSVLYCLAVAYIIGLAIYQGGRALLG